MPPLKSIVAVALSLVRHERAMQRSGEQVVAVPDDAARVTNQDAGQLPDRPVTAICDVCPGELFRDA